MTQKPFEELPLSIKMDIHILDKIRCQPVKASQRRFVGCMGFASIFCAEILSHKLLLFTGLFLVFMAALWTSHQMRLDRVNRWFEEREEINSEED